MNDILIKTIDTGMNTFESVENGENIVKYLEMLLYCVVHNKKIPIENVIDFSEFVQNEFLPDDDEQENFVDFWLLMLIQECHRYNNEKCKS